MYKANKLNSNEKFCNKYLSKNVYTEKICKKTIYKVS